MKISRRTVVLGGAVAAGAAAFGIKPRDQGGAHNDYFRGLGKALQDAGLVRPVLVLLTFPVTLITLGLFLFVINAAMFWAASYLLASFQVAGFVAALIGSVLYSLCAMVIDVAMERIFPS